MEHDNRTYTDEGLSVWEGVLNGEVPPVPLIRGTCGDCLVKEFVGLISLAGSLQFLPGYNVGLVSINEGEGGNAVALEQLLLLCGDRPNDLW